MQDPNAQFLVVAGEASGDLHGSSLVAALKQHFPSAGFTGMGGTRMRKEGVKTLFDIERMGAVGLVEVLGELPHHLKVYRNLAREIASGRYDSSITPPSTCAWPAAAGRRTRRCFFSSVPRSGPGARAASGKYASG